MAAAIKMDELLVSWLGSDNVYQNVLNLIETHRAEAAKKQSKDGLATPNTTPKDEMHKHANTNNTPNSNINTGTNVSGSSSNSPPTSPSRPQTDHHDKNTTNNDPLAKELTKLKLQDEEMSDTDSEASSLFGVSIIPPFYSSNGRKNPPLHRRKHTFDQDQSWDGDTTTRQTNTLDATPPPPPPPPDSLSAPPTPTNAASSSSTTSIHVPTLPIRDQVKAIYDELGKAIDAKDRDGSSLSYYLTTDSFVRITKEICNFPTFFNGPLYRRILYLWNTRFVDSKEERERIWTLYENGTIRIGALEPPEKEEEDADGAATDGSLETSDDGKKKGDWENVLSQEEEENGAGGKDQALQVITYEMFHWFWIQEMEDYDLSDRFFRLLKKPEQDYVGRDDFLPYIKELLRDHPGLEFLSNHAEFQDKYAITVITRIFYSVNRCHSGRITSRQIRRSDLLSAFQQVDEEEDINKVTRYFSYEHFYVLYCRFWELDHDRDYKITREDLLKYGEHCLSHMIVDRIFDAAPRPFEGKSEAAEQGTVGAAGVNREFLSYEDFIFFMLSEEDKANEISVRYWFSCIDVDGDGRLNNMEMRSFYAVQLHRMQCMGHEIVPFEDMLCQMIDMIKPSNNDYLVVEDFLQAECAQVSGALFDALFNLNKYLQFEQRDPFMERQKREDEFDTDWDRFACIDYNRLAMEEEQREEEAMEMDCWASVDDEDDDGEEFNSMVSSEAPF